MLDSRMYDLMCNGTSEVRYLDESIYEENMKLGWDGIWLFLGEVV